MKLTETIVKTLPTPDKARLDSDDVQQGLYLKRTPTGRKTFVYRSNAGGQWQVVTLGTWPGTTLAQARTKASELANSHNVEVGLTFGKLLDRWYMARVESRYSRPETTAHYIQRGKDALGKRQLAALATRELVHELQRYAKTSRIAANRCLAAWKLALDYAVEIGAIDLNPLARTTARAVGGEEKPRERVLTDDELRVLWACDEPHAALLRFILLTGFRLNEARSCYLDGEVFRIDASKNGKPHWVAATPAAIEQFNAIHRTSPVATQNWLNAKGWGYTAHDLRRTCSTRLAGLGVEPHVVEKILNHTMQGVMGTYNRHDYAEQRVNAALLWEKELLKIAKDA